MAATRDICWCIRPTSDRTSPHFPESHMTNDGWPSGASRHVCHELCNNLESSKRTSERSKIETHLNFNNILVKTRTGTRALGYVGSCPSGLRPVGVVNPSNPSKKDNMRRFKGLVTRDVLSMALVTSDSSLGESTRVCLLGTAGVVFLCCGDSSSCARGCVF